MVFRKKEKFLIVGMGKQTQEISDIPELSVKFLEDYATRYANENLAENKNEKNTVAYQDLWYSKWNSELTSLRVAQYMLPNPETTAFFACVDNTEELTAIRDGVQIHYLQKMQAGRERTGTYLASYSQRWKNARIYYHSGFFLPICSESMIEMARYANKSGGLYCLNLNAEFQIKIFEKEIKTLMESVDILFITKKEARSLKAILFRDDPGENPDENKNDKAIARKISTFGQRSILVVIAHNRTNYIVVHDDKLHDVPISSVASPMSMSGRYAQETCIIDDAFIGGFLASKSLKYEIADCVRAGIQASRKFKNGVPETLSSDTRNKNALVLEEQQKKACPTPLVDQDSTFRSIWDSVMGIVLVYVSIWLPFSLAYYSQPPAETTNIDQCTDVFFAADVPLNFITTYESDEGERVEDLYKIGKRYLTSWFFIDVFSTLPFEMFLGSDTARLSKLTKVIRMLKLLKMLRLSKLGRLVPRLQAKYDIKNSTLSVGRFLIAIFLTAHWCGCLFFLLARWQDFSDETWVVIRQFEGKSLLESPISLQYLNSLYWSFTIMTTIGFGDIIPGTDIERLFVSFFMFLGACIFAYGISNMCSVVLNLDKNAVLFTTLQDNINFFMEKRKMPPKISKHVKDYLLYKYYTSGVDMFENCKVLEKVSKNLRKDFYYEHCNSLFIYTYVIKRFGEEFVSLVGSKLVGKVYAPHETIILEGFPYDRIYLIAKGEVEVLLNMEIDVTSRGNIKMQPRTFRLTQKRLSFTNRSAKPNKLGRKRCKETHPVMGTVYNKLNQNELPNQATVTADLVILPVGTSFNELGAFLKQPSTLSIFAANFCDIYYVKTEHYMEVLEEHFLEEKKTIEYECKQLKKKRDTYLAKKEKMIESKGYQKENDKCKQRSTMDEKQSKPMSKEECNLTDQKEFLDFTLPLFKNTGEKWEPGNLEIPPELAPVNDTQSEKKNL